MQVTWTRRGETWPHVPLYSRCPSQSPSQRTIRMCVVQRATLHYNYLIHIAAMKTTLCLSMLFACATAVQHLTVSDVMAARIDTQAWRVDRLTKQFQTISDLADGARAAAKAGGDTARHLMNYYLDGTSILAILTCIGTLVL